MLTNSTFFLKVVAILGPQLKPFEITDKDDKKVYVTDAALIRLLADGLRVSYKIMTPPDGEFGRLQSDGSWSGMIGMIQRSEADLAIAAVYIAEERRFAVNFSYPHSLSQIAFVTNKPEPLSMNSTIYRPFKYEIWITLLLFLITVAIVLSIISNKRSFQSIASNTFGSLLLQPFTFKMEMLSLRVLLVAWLLTVFVISNSYKTSLLSSLTKPYMFGIHTISDLIEAVQKNSVKCFMGKGSYTMNLLLQSKAESWKAIGECLKRDEIASGNADVIFYKYPYRKIFIGHRSYLDHFRSDFLTSKESIFFLLAGMPYSESFCCLKKLNELIHRLAATGLIQKSIDDEQFHFWLNMTSFNSIPPTFPRQLRVEDFLGTFSILLCGWIFSFTVLLMEIIIEKYFKRFH